MTRAATEPITPDLEFKSMNTCDGCGRQLTKSEQLAGICRQCSPPEQVHTSVRRQLRGKERPWLKSKRGA
jgi:predicted amidophosphoribosyltransferase